MPAEDGLADRWTLQVFARVPVAGQVKTRLIPRLGAEGAADLHCCLVRSALARACAVSGARVELWIAGDPRDAFVQDCARRFRVPVFEQSGADLGARMHHAIAHALAPPRAAPCVLIGSDCPAQTPVDLQQAAAALASFDVVLQPAHDGGYVLIGLARPQPGLFEAIAWGGARVFAQTLQRAAALDLKVHRLRELPDLDDEAGLQLALQQGWIDR